MKLAFFRLKLYLIKTGIIVLPILLIIILFKVLTGIHRDYSRYKFGSEGQEHETPHFYIFSKQIPLSPQQAGEMVENFYQAFRNTYKELNFVGLERKGEIFLFGNREEFDQYYRKEFLRELPHNAAYYNPRDGKIVLYWTSTDNTQQTLYHELTHMILDQALGVYEPEWSVWFNEGIATYFEQCQVQEGKIVPGPLNQNMLIIIQHAWHEKKFISLNRLTLSQREEFRGPNNHLYYYESYLLVYFLLHYNQGQYRQQFYRYFQEEAGPGPCRSLWNILKQDPQELEGAFRKYFRIE